MGDDDLTQHRRHSSSGFSGMDSVLASVSGYTGLERFNLIKLIHRSGASYVGNMTPAVTHLVCRKFEGKKYEFAKRFSILVVNHRWIEECVRKERRVSEDSFIFLSGKEIGPLCFGIDSRIGDSTLKKKLKEPVIDVEEYEDTDTALWDDDSILFSQDLLPGTRQNSRGSDRSLRKRAKRNSRKDPISNSSHCENLPEPIIIVLDEPGTSQLAQFRRLRKRDHTSQEPDTEARTVVNRKTREHDMGSTLNIDPEVKMLHENILSNNERHLSTDTGNQSDQTCSMSGKNDNHAITDVEETENMNDEFQNEHNNGAGEDLVDVDVSNGPPTTNELSCVICWTEFSSTRGVLPCGHRFCFSCIQNWADHMGSQRKTSTCPLCKANFTCITKVDDAHSSDQKIYSQTFPYDSSNMDFYILPYEASPFPANLSAQVCYQCSSREPEDLLVRCHYCNIRCVHSFCLDPPLFPWTCMHCRDLRRLYNGH